MIPALECQPKPGKRRRACKDCTCGMKEKIEAEDAAKRSSADKALNSLKLDADEKKLHEQLAAAATDYAKAAELDAQLKGLQAEKGEVEEAWLVASELAEG